MNFSFHLKCIDQFRLKTTTSFNSNVCPFCGLSKCDTGVETSEQFGLFPQHICLFRVGLLKSFTAQLMNSGKSSVFFNQDIMKYVSDVLE